ncbi:SREBP regulating gene protein isoform X1 [Felis catus]|uniref:SREBP regulating gene protein isoform X1 n=1 Tax=Felis catus TaxID=9685 RepID=UPI001D19FB2D|nr:SREBP regulating gene protein isoform X1 [Felis catus]
MPPGPRAFPAVRPGRRAPRPRRHGEPGGYGVAPAPPEEEERAVRDRNLLQVQDHDQPIPWKVQFHLGNSSRPGNQCRNSIQGKHLITDELGYICERKDLLVNGCCNVNVPGTKQYRCDGCLPNGCCSAYEYCVSCCLQPSKQLLLERFLNRAAVAFQNLFMAVEDHFELCLAKCRTSSQMRKKKRSDFPESLLRFNHRTRTRTSSLASGPLSPLASSTASSAMIIPPTGPPP